MLIAKVLEWARASGGRFPVANQPGVYSGPDDFGPDTVSRIKWARVKSLPRTLEKLMRTYHEVTVRTKHAKGALYASTYTEHRTCAKNTSTHRGGGEQDISRMVDVCRQTIIFDSLKGQRPVIPSPVCDPGP
jgi:hypothetical protein